MKKMVFVPFLFLLFYSFQVSSLNIRLATAAEPVRILADGSVDPPTAPITHDGDLYILIGNITSDSDGIIIERDNMTLDGAGFWVQGSGTGITLSGRNNVTVKNAQIRGFSLGVLLDSCQNIIVFGNNVTENGGYGIYLSGSSNNNVSQNRVIRYSDAGISLNYYSHSNSIVGNYVAKDVYGGIATGIGVSLSDSNTLIGNTVSNSWIGIYLGGCSNAFLRDNSVISDSQTVNPHGLNVEGEEGNMLHYIHDIDASNTIQGKPIYYWVDKTDMIVPSDAGFVALINCSRITAQNLKLTKNWISVLLFSTSDSTISNNEITNSYYGMWLYASSGNTFSQNNMTSCDGYGIFLLAGSNNNRFVGNNVTWSNYAGIYHVSSLGTILEGNYIANSYYIEGLGIVISQSASVNLTGNTVSEFPTGIVLGSGGNTLIGNVISTTDGSGIVLSSGNVLRTNTISASEYSITVFATILDPSSFVNDVDSSNTVNGKPVYYWVDQHDMTVPSDAGYVFLVSCSGITVQNLNLTGEGQGVGLISTSSSTVTHNYLSGNDVGVQTLWSTGNSITENTIAGNLVKGIEIREGSNNNIVSGNNMSSNGYGYNIIVMQSSNNIISGNYIHSSQTAGIYLLYSADDIVSGNDIAGIWHSGGRMYGAIVLDATTGTLITGNNITQCNTDAISLFGAQNNNITDNNIIQNLRSIRFEGVSSGNRIYRNNFVENGLWIVSSQPNSWDNGYPDGGNYWDTYTDVDNYGGVGQNQTSGDGIWDHQLNLTQDGNNIDHYPLVVPTVPIVRQFESYGRNVEVYSNSSISEFEFNVTAKAISFTVTGQTGTSGFCDVAVPKDLIWGTLTLYKDGLLLSEGADYTRTDNSTHCIFHIADSPSRPTIGSSGPYAIPEFSSLITILPLLVSAMLLVFLVSKRRLSRFFSSTLDM